jgi:hypothetical protein
MNNIASVDDGERLLSPAPYVLCVKYVDMTVLLDVEHGQYYSLNDTGGDIWKMLCEGHTRTAIVSALANEYGIDTDTATHDVHVLLNEMLDATLIHVTTENH